MLNQYTIVFNNTSADKRNEFAHLPGTQAAGLTIAVVSWLDENKHPFSNVSAQLVDNKGMLSIDTTPEAVDRLKTLFAANINSVTMTKEDVATPAQKARKPGR